MKYRHASAIGFDNGGGRGIGAATARLAAAQGYDVAISFVSNESAALAVAADVEAVGRLKRCENIRCPAWEKHRRTSDTSDWIGKRVEGMAQRSVLSLTYRQ
jgi:NAD(P)-dependent dehydrogenase (short-subunit alcohol dehydrogenase family)